MSATAKTATRATLPVVQKETEKDWWIKPIKWVAFAVFILVPILGFFVQPFAGRIVWTIVVASIPIFIVHIGYHRWRKICPLAFISQIPTKLGKSGKQKASQEFENTYYYVMFGIFFVSLWIRLIATNGDGRSIATFFILLSLAALIIGAVFTGKTWCNYICPVSFIEKIYTEPHGLRQTENSQCVKCTACKKSCPDISEENGYWKEITLSSKRFAYYAFPGIVFGFYFYYFLQSGTWDYYFGGKWTNEQLPLLRLFLPGTDNTTAGFFFLPVVPRALAAILTLALCSLVSFIVFLRVEKIVAKHFAQSDETQTRHITFTVAAFTAFVTFYTFAGAPTLRKLPWMFPQLFIIAVVLTATLFLVRRLRRNQTDFAEETLARNIIKRWEWTDMEPPKDLQEAFVIHQTRSKGAAQVLEFYKEAMREALSDGYITREEVQMLDSLRSKLQIKKSDHERIMSALAEEERAMLANPTTAEKRLQLNTYMQALTGYFEKALETSKSLDDSLIKKLRDEYRVTREEHEKIVDRIFGSSERMAQRLSEEVKEVEQMTLAIQQLKMSPSPARLLLCDILKRDRDNSVKRLLQGMAFSQLDEGFTRKIREALTTDEGALHTAILEEIKSKVAGPIAERLIASHNDMVSLRSSMPTMSEVLSLQLQNSDPYARALTLYVLFARKGVSEETLQKMSEDENEFVRDAAQGLLKRKQSKRETDAEDEFAKAATESDSLLWIEKMIALRNAPLFQKLLPAGLAELAHASREDFFAPNSTLCIEGEEGNEVFIVLSGEVEIWRGSGESKKLAGREGMNGLIGEMAILDPAPRSATVTASDKGVRVLRLDGKAFRNAFDNDTSIAAGIIRTLAQRLRNK
jgi:hypothetical protein